VVAVGTDKILVGAHRDDTAGLNAGAMYLFDDDTGTLLQTVTKAGASPDDEFGRAVAASWPRLYGGAPLDDTRGLDAGAAYAFTDVSCGNGMITAGEQCDDGNTVSGDGCDATCRTTGCGSGIVTGGEQCDDGNTTSGDGCSATCQSEGVCGDGIQQPLEACDDGDLQSGDGCDANCTPTGCGNGIVTAGEQCDSGTQNGINLCCSVACMRIDADGDGVCDQNDLCPTVPDGGQTNTDHDVFGDACDICPTDGDNDSDDDGFCVGATHNPPAVGSGDPCSRPADVGAWIKPTVLFGNLDMPDGNNKLRVKGFFTIGATVPLIAPHLHGVQIRVADRNGTLIVDEHVPGGLYTDQNLRGWRTVGSPPNKWIFLDKNDTQAYNGINQVAVWDRSKTSPGLMRVVVSAKKHGTYLIGPGQEPVTATIELNDTALPPGGTRGRDQCGEVAFAQAPVKPGCKFVSTNVLSCK
jgi:cysteine-rich repeat protein